MGLSAPTLLERDSLDIFRALLLLLLRLIGVGYRLSLVSETDLSLFSKRYYENSPSSDSVDYWLFLTAYFLEEAFGFPEPLDVTALLSSLSFVIHC